jgi:hypothetical protein
VEDLDRLGDALGFEQGAMMSVAVVLGLCWSEVPGPTVKSLDYQRGEISVTHQLDPKEGLVQPKTKTGTRTMSVPACPSPSSPDCR